MTGTQILNELDDLRAYAERLEEDIEYREEILEDDKKKTCRHRTTDSATRK